MFHLIHLDQLQSALDLFLSTLPGFGFDQIQL